MIKKSQIEVPVISDRVLGVKTYRGYARLVDLALMSKADVYDQKKNPFGTQRDLSQKHARLAYEYIKTQETAYWPEVFLAVRMPEVFEFVPDKTIDAYGTLHVNMDLARLELAISRVDGNHRLHYADGHAK